ncbi:hypothetical protein CCACVL1_08489 [Corchorus capsularis]|uniref:Uncharacterized protein n=1 Tax=Corchorus capsularis TaxID=210143 RepID=A0A1R3J0C7_COCAP|nr:hypothetical protein CCACVL1_08489 [Corchorus capsularis]
MAESLTSDSDTTKAEIIFFSSFSYFA